MNYKQTIAAMSAIAVSGLASAHQGLPGHVHAEMSIADQAFHTAINWAPVAGLGLIAAFGLVHAVRRSSSR